MTVSYKRNETQPKVDNAVYYSQFAIFLNSRIYIVVGIRPIDGILFAFVRRVVKEGDLLRRFSVLAANLLLGAKGV